MATLLLSVLGAFAEFERALINGTHGNLLSVVYLAACIHTREFRLRRLLRCAATDEHADG